MRLEGISLLPHQSTPSFLAVSSGEVDAAASQTSRIKIQKLVFDRASISIHTFLHPACIHAPTSITISSSPNLQELLSSPPLENQRGYRFQPLFHSSATLFVSSVLFLLLFPLFLISPSGYHPFSWSLKALISPLFHPLPFSSFAPLLQ